MPGNEEVDTGKSGAGDGRSVVEAGRSECNRVAVKVPPFWSNNVRLYFAQVEANFRVSNVTQEQTKFDTLVAALDSQTLSHAADLVYAPPKETPYQKLKDRLISEFEVSRSGKVRTLLHELELGENKPSWLLRQMRELSGGRLEDTFLKDLWFGRLPASMQAILATSTEELAKLADIADRIAEYSMNAGDGMVNAVSGQPIVMGLQEQISGLEKQVANLSMKWAHGGQDKVTRRQPGREEGPYRQGYRDRSRSPVDRRSYRAGSRGSPVARKKEWLCFYHFKFGEKAVRCEPPCSYVPKNG